MVSQRREFTVAGTRARRIGRAEIGRNDAQDGLESDLVVDDLGAALLGRDKLEVLVTPGVAADLMALGDHAADDGRVPRAGVLDLAFGAIVADDEEGGLNLVGLEDVEELAGVDVGAVVKGQGHLALLDALGDVDAVGDVAESWARDARRVAAGGDLVSVAGGPVRELAAGGTAVLAAGAANPVFAAAQPGATDGVAARRTALGASTGPSLQPRFPLLKGMAGMTCDERARSQQGEEGSWKLHDDGCKRMSMVSETHQV